MKRTQPTRVSARAAGFTLIEVMVVVIIVGVITSLAVIGLGDNAARRLDEEAFRFASLVRLAADEAVLQGREIGLEIRRDGYAFHQFDDQFRRWIPLSSSRLYRERTLPDGITLDLRLDDTELVLLAAAQDEEDGETDQPEPQVLLLSSGEMTPFELIFEFVELDKRVTLKVSPTGVVETLIDDAR